MDGRCSWLGGNAGAAKRFPARLLCTHCADFCPTPRLCSYHSATLIGGKVWLVSGGDAETVFGDCIVFDPEACTYERPSLRGDLGLLMRTAHGACVHPQRPECLLLFGGYGGQLDSATQEYR